MLMIVFSFFFFLVWLNAACTASILLIYPITSCPISVISKLGLCGKRPSRVIAACCVSSNITAAFPHRHTCFHLSCLWGWEPGGSPHPPPLLHALARTRAWRASWLTDCGRPFWCIKWVRNIWTGLCIFSWFLTWTMWKYDGNFWVVASLGSLSGFEPSELFAQSASLWDPSPFVKEDILSLPLSPSTLVLSFALSDDSLWCSLSDIRPCNNISIFFGVYFWIVWSTSMACRLPPVTQFHSQVSVLHGKAEDSSPQYTAGSIPTLAKSHQKSTLLT